jgi:hypothetical protein
MLPGPSLNQKKEPYTIKMLCALERLVKYKPDGLDAFLALNNTVYDWTRLGLFMGSYIAKYAQTHLKDGARFNTIPTTLDACA